MSSTSSPSRPTWATFARPAIAVTSAAAATVCVLAAWQIMAPQRAPVIFPYSETYYARAVDAVAAGQQAQALEWAAKATHAAPARAENWVLTAYVYETMDQRISPRVVDAMRKSYEVAPLSVDAHDFRLSQVFSNWSAFPDDLHRLALQEARVYSSLTLGLNSLDALAPSIQDPNGRMALGIVVVQATTQRRIKYRQQELAGTRAPDGTVITAQ